MTSKKENRIKKTVKFELWLFNLISSKVNPKKKERNNWSKALHFKFKELREKNKRLSKEIKKLKEYKARRRPQKKQSLPINMRKCPMYNGEYVSLDICERCKKVSPARYEGCQKTILTA